MTTNPTDLMSELTERAKALGWTVDVREGDTWTDGSAEFTVLIQPAAPEEQR